MVSGDLISSIFSVEGTDRFLKIKTSGSIKGKSPCVSVVQVDKKYALLVMDPDCEIGPDKLSTLFNTNHIEVLSKQKVKQLFPELNCCIELLFKEDYQMPIYCSKRILNQSTITFTNQNDGMDYTLNMSDFLRQINEKRLRKLL